MRTGGGFLVAQSVFILFLLKVALKYIPDEFADIPSLKQAVSYFPYFITGVIISRYKLFDRLKEQSIVYTVSLMVVIGSLCFTVFKQYTQISALHGLTAIAIIALLSCIACYRKDKTTKVEMFLEKLGRKTLDIYIYHYFIILSIHLQQTGVWFTQTSNFLMEFILCTLISFIIAFMAIVVGKVIKRSPLISSVVYGDFVSYNRDRIEWKGLVK